ncbi:hypothetical protein [Sphingobacterium sp. HMA12]|uniref:hypothetical protein n=1 Tax=Sphingobacterium sp. HMA12 TaxID=2050894 RepID=UPI00131524C4|nr:hypothetical protein [Sphingobacterium sp. HMA12]
MWIVYRAAGAYLRSISGNIVLFELHHRGGARFGSLPPRETIAYDRPQLHSTGYKQSSLTIQQIGLDTKNLHITAAVQQTIMALAVIQ